MIMVGTEYYLHSPSSSGDEALDIAAIAQAVSILFDAETRQAGRHWTLGQGHRDMLTIDRKRPGKTHTAVSILELIFAFACQRVLSLL